MTVYAPVKSFEVEVVLPLSTRTRQVVATEAEAVALAQEWVGPNQCQVTITAHVDSNRSFAVRHFTWVASQPKDSGWRIWVDGTFMGGGDLPFPSRTIITEDGVEVAEGDRVFDYYGCHWGVIGTIDDQGWFYHHRDDGGRGLLNGQRVCVRIPPGNPFFKTHGHGNPS